MADFTIKDFRSGAKGRYAASAPGKPEAELTYSVMNAHTIIIDHTGVPDGWRGVGVGKALVQRAVEDARARGVKIVALCPFAKAQIAKTPEWHDVLA